MWPLPDRCMLLYKRPGYLDSGGLTGLLLPFFHFMTSVKLLLRRTEQLSTLPTVQADRAGKKPHTRQWTFGISHL